MSKTKVTTIDLGKKSKVALCAIGIMENQYVAEFVNHYKNLGFDKIFLYDNN